MPQVEVMFRKFRYGVIALFPCEPGTIGNPAHCLSFEHVGQHGPADLAGVIEVTRPAAPGEYAALKRELESAPYDYLLTVRERTPPGAWQVRAAKLQAQRNTR